MPPCYSLISAGNKGFVFINIMFVNAWEYIHKPPGIPNAPLKLMPALS